MSQDRGRSLGIQLPQPTGLTRRSFLLRVPLAALAAHPLLRQLAWAQAPGTGRLIVHRPAPLMAEMPLASLNTWPSLKSSCGYSNELSELRKIGA